MNRSGKSAYGPGYARAFSRLGKYDSTSEDVENIIHLLDLPDGASFLDVPCGWGRHAGLLASRGYRVTGVDMSAWQVHRARKLFPNATYARADMRNVPDGPFDAVLNLWTSFGILPDRSDDQVALNRWSDVTKHGGALVMELTTRENAEAQNRRGTEAMTRKKVVVNGVREDAVIDWTSGISTNTYRRGLWKETSEMRLYERSTIRGMLASAGYGRVETFGGFDRRPVTDDRRTVFLARKI